MGTAFKGCLVVGAKLLRLTSYPIRQFASISFQKTIMPLKTHPAMIMPRRKMLSLQDDGRTHNMSLQFHVCHSVFANDGRNIKTSHRINFFCSVKIKELKKCVTSTNGNVP